MNAEKQRSGYFEACGRSLIFEHSRMSTGDSSSLIKLRDEVGVGRKGNRQGQGLGLGYSSPHAATLWLGSPRSATISHLNFPSNYEDIPVKVTGHILLASLLVWLIAFKYFNTLYEGIHLYSCPKMCTFALNLQTSGIGLIEHNFILRSFFLI